MCPLCILWVFCIIVNMQFLPYGNSVTDTLAFGAGQRISVEDEYLTMNEDREERGIASKADCLVLSITHSPSPYLRACGTTRCGARDRSGNEEAP
jgi:hypothetical protein